MRVMVWGLTGYEVAFYDALEVNDSAAKVLGEPTLQKIAHELVESVCANTTINRTIKESVGRSSACSLSEFFGNMDTHRTNRRKRPIRCWSRRNYCVRASLSCSRRTLAHGWRGLTTGSLQVQERT